MVQNIKSTDAKPLRSLMPASATSSGSGSNEQHAVSQMLVASCQTPSRTPGRLPRQQQQRKSTDSMTPSTSSLLVLETPDSQAIRGSVEDELEREEQEEEAADDSLLSHAQQPQQDAASQSKRDDPFAPTQLGPQSMTQGEGDFAAASSSSFQPILPSSRHSYATSQPSSSLSSLARAASVAAAGSTQQQALPPARITIHELIGPGPARRVHAGSDAVQQRMAEAGAPQQSELPRSSGQRRTTSESQLRRIALDAVHAFVADARGEGRSRKEISIPSDEKDAAEQDRSHRSKVTIALICELQQVSLAAATVPTFFQWACLADQCFRACDDRFQCGTIHLTFSPPPHPPLRSSLRSQNLCYL